MLTAATDQQFREAEANLQAGPKEQTGTRRNIIHPAAEGDDTIWGRYVMTPEPYCVVTP